MVQIGITGKPRRMAEKCSTCIYRPGNLMHLREGALQEITDENRRRGTLLPCHQTLEIVPGNRPGQEAACRGFADAYSEGNAQAELAIMLGGWEDVEPPAGKDKDNG